MIFIPLTRLGPFVLFDLLILSNPLNPFTPSYLFAQVSSSLKKPGAVTKSKVANIAPVTFPLSEHYWYKLFSGFEQTLWSQVYSLKGLYIKKLSIKQIQSRTNQNN